MTTAGLILGDCVHYLDHLAPLCALHTWPLIVSEPSLALLAKMYYPGLTIIEKDWKTLDLPEHIVSCHPRPFLESCFLSRFSAKTSWLPHGNSDKGWKSEVFEMLCHEEKAYVYGRKMIDAIQEKSKKIPEIEIVSNFRKSYFTQHRNFYRELIERKFPLIHPQNIKLLYAPTWADFEESCSFWQAFPTLAAHLPENYTLLIKLHPNTELSFAPEIERLIGKFSRSNIVWVQEFPPIYPLIDLADGYIGDMSSIGYDFLSENKPMYFLNNQKREPASDPGLYLYRCGIHLPPEQYADLFSLDQKTRSEDARTFTAIRKQVYDYTFS